MTRPYDEENLHDYYVCMVITYSESEDQSGYYVIPVKEEHSMKEGTDVFSNRSWLKA